LSVWFIYLLIKKRVKSWKKAITIISLVIFVLLLAAIVVGQILGSKVGLNLFEYSLI
jgi:hypothetical protein